MIYTIIVFFIGSNDNQKLYSASGYIHIVSRIILRVRKRQRDETKHVCNKIWNVAELKLNNRASIFIGSSHAIHAERCFWNQSEFFNLLFTQTFFKTNTFQNQFAFLIFGTYFYSQNRHATAALKLVLNAKQKKIKWLIQFIIL